MSAQPQLREIATTLQSGGKSPVVTVRDFIWWFYAERRGYKIVQQIRRHLKAAGLRTVPNFEHVWIDARITFELVASDLKSAPASDATDQPSVPVSDAAETENAIPIWVSKEATYRISRLAAANQVVVSVKPDESLASTITKMMAGGFSQLPVMQNEREVRGIVSWQTIGSRLALGVKGETARELSEAHQEIPAERSIFDAIPVILAHDYVLVRDEKMAISGIITAADLTLQFRELTEPFLLLSEIENLLRNLIADRFSSAELAEACDSRDATRGRVTTVADLSFGEYIRLLQNPDRWGRLSMAVDRVAFCKKADQVRIIRNDVMHFDPDGIGETELTQLREFTRFMQQLMSVLGKTL